MRQDMLSDALARLLDRAAPTPEGEWSADLWASLEAMQLPRAALDETLGGGGVPMADLFGVVKLAGARAIAAPLIEALVAGRLAGLAGLSLPQGSLSVGASEGLQLRRDGEAWRLSGALRDVPWGGQVDHLVVAAMDGDASYLAVIAPSGVETHVNYAGEPRDHLAIDDALVVAAAPLEGAAERLLAHMACARSVQMSGAIERLLEISSEYVKTRVQFGRTLSQFQAIQQSVAVLAEQSEAAAVAAHCAWYALEGPHEALWTAMAKTRVGEAATTAAATSHQVHGAIGFTREYVLHSYTRRLWSWRVEFGDERRWAADAGRRLAAAPDGFWAALTALPA